MTFARMFKFLVMPGRQEAYVAYLRDIVSPIDEAAREAGVFDRMHTIVPEVAGDWNHGRIFLFRDRTQRDRFAAGIAKHAAAFDGDAAATAARKAFADTLRGLIGVADFQID